MTKTADSVMKEAWEMEKKEDLILELGRYRKKIRDQRNEIRELQDRIVGYDEGVREMAQALDSIIDRLIDKYGSIGYGGEFIAIPKEMRDRKKYRCGTMSKDDLYIIVRFPADEEEDS